MNKLLVKTYVFDERDRLLATLRTVKHAEDEWHLFVVMTDAFPEGADVVVIVTYEASRARRAHTDSAVAIAGEKGRTVTLLPGLGQRV